MNERIWVFFAVKSKKKQICLRFYLTFSLPIHLDNFQYIFHPIHLFGPPRKKNFPKMSSQLVCLGLLLYLEPESTCIFTRFLTIIVLKWKKFEEIFRENAYSENILPRCEWYEMN